MMRLPRSESALSFFLLLLPIFIIRRAIDWLNLRFILRKRYKRVRVSESRFIGIVELAIYIRYYILRIIRLGMRNISMMQCTVISIKQVICALDIIFE